MLESDVQPFLDIVQKIYADLPATVTTVFSQEAPKTAQPNPAVPGVGPSSLSLDSQPKKTTGLVRSTQSFKVLIECPIIVVLLFQLHPRYTQVNIPKFMPLIAHALSLVAPKPALTTHRTAYVDFLAAQVKVSLYSGVVWNMRDVELAPFSGDRLCLSLPTCSAVLPITCGLIKTKSLRVLLLFFSTVLTNALPQERYSATIRNGFVLLIGCYHSKELLIATRHILATDFRSGFVSQIDTLLDEQVLIGSGRTSFETIRFASSYASPIITFANS